MALSYFSYTISCPPPRGRVWVGGFFLLLATLLLVLEGVWWLHDPDEAELNRTEVAMQRIDRYLLIANGDTVMAFADYDGKLRLSDGFTAIDSMDAVAASDCGLWVNNLPGIPSCKGRIAVMTERDRGLCPVSSSDLHTSIARQLSSIDSVLAVHDKQSATLAVYMRTHSVIEQGFDLVARYDEHLRHATDSLVRIQACLASRIKKGDSLLLSYDPLYYALVNKDGKTQRVRCEILSTRDSLTILRTLNGEMADSVTRLSQYDKIVPVRLRKRQQDVFKVSEISHPAFILNLVEGREEGSPLGTYRGEMNAQRQPHGFGCLMGTDGSYYEGEWSKGKREGFGFAMSAESKMSVGEWKGDRFLGERMVYSNDRIYGIDISRYQHESSNRRKKYSINWDNLAITSLGTISRKVVKGTIDYPISFIYIKSTEGISIRNKYYASDYTQARKRGYKVGAYHFFSTKRSGLAQAKYFCANTFYRHGDFPPVLDVEPSPSQISQMGGAAALRKQMKAWLDYVEALWHVRPILYVSQKFIYKYLASDPELMEGYRFWIARYGEYRPDVHPVYWQLCPDGRVRGIHGDVDINVFNGFGTEFAEFK